MGCASSEQSELTSGSPGLSPMPCVSIAGTEGPEEGAAPGAPQVRASPGPARQEHPGGPRPRRGARAPGRALAPAPARSEDTLRVPYQSVTLKSKLSPTPSVGNHVLLPRLETRSSNNGGRPGRARHPPTPGVPARSHVRRFPKIRAKESTPVITFTFSPNGICDHLG